MLKRRSLRAGAMMMVMWVAAAIIVCFDQTVLFVQTGGASRRWPMPTRDTGNAKQASRIIARGSPDGISDASNRGRLQFGTVCVLSALTGSMLVNLADYFSGTLPQQTISTTGLDMFAPSMPLSIRGAESERILEEALLEVRGKRGSADTVRLLENALDKLREPPELRKEREESVIIQDEKQDEMDQLLSKALDEARIVVEEASADEAFGNEAGAPAPPVTEAAPQDILEGMKMGVIAFGVGIAGIASAVVASNAMPGQSVDNKSNSPTAHAFDELAVGSMYESMDAAGSWWKFEVKSKNADGSYNGVVYDSRMSEWNNVWAGNCRPVTNGSAADSSTTNPSA